MHCPSSTFWPHDTQHNDIQHNNKYRTYVIKQVASNKSSLLQIEKQNTQTLQQRYLKQKVFTEVTKMPSWKAWVQRSSGLIQSWRKCKHF
jgi:hypothetical protein